MSLIEEQRNIVVDELSAFMQRVRENHIKAGQRASGRTADSIRMESDGEMFTVFGRQAFWTLEHGRAGGRVPHDFVSIIRQWMQDKGIKAAPIKYIRKPSEKWQPKYTPQERGDLSLAGAIAHTIKTKGTKLYRQGGRDDIYSNEISRTTEAIQKRVMALLRIEIEHINKGSKEE